MGKQADAVHEGRRTFLRDMAGAGTAATALVVTGGAVADAEAPTDGSAADETADPRGYHVTPHIDTYYRKARF